MRTGSAFGRFDGSDPQFLEVGGFNIGTLEPLNCNFGFGQLIVGQPGQSKEVHLRDAYDNGNGHDLCGEGREALYLFGVDSDPNGLVINNGSTLVLDALDIYVRQNGGFIHINDLFGEDEMEISFDGGIIRKGSPFPDADSDGDGYGDVCEADLNNDGNVD